VRRLSPRTKEARIAGNEIEEWNGFPIPYYNPDRNYRLKTDNVKPWQWIIDNGGGTRYFVNNNIVSLDIIEFLQLRNAFSRPKTCF
jgi:hypothetical protein